MSQKYQNEKSPIVYSVKKPKTLGKVKKMTVLQAWEIYQMFGNTLYLYSYNKKFNVYKV